LAITQRFLYSTYPMKGITCIFTQTFHYPTFQLLDVSALPCIGGIFIIITGIFGNFYSKRVGIFDFQNGNSRWPWLWRK